MTTISFTCHVLIMSVLFKLAVARQSAWRHYFCYLYCSCLFIDLCSRSCHRDSVRTIFVKQGTDVLFEVNEAVEFTAIRNEFRWQFNSSYTILTFEKGGNKIYPAYKTKINVRGNFSFLLKNVQLNDSGRYTAQLEGDAVKTEYRVQVQAPVSSVQLMVTSMSAINDLCNISVKCTEGHESIESTFDCEGDNCITHNTTSAVKLQVFFSNVSIVCNNSNDVSWATTAVEVPDVCTQSRGFWTSVLGKLLQFVQ
ncbi:uncharacterized protein [Nerophis lumbriciformis]|uniref:uncharacterized protein isoform X5 n=1 Tax=Nerophis lumbriciformis TaxID=546530 RepID=UPI002ADFA7D5|nr:uncharacterized protein LOC133618556 isoform X5 [Nerophis lumbriciformis]